MTLRFKIKQFKASKLNCLAKTLFFSKFSKINLLWATIRNNIDKKKIEPNKYIVFSQGNYSAQVLEVDEIYPLCIEQSYSPMYRYLKSRAILAGGTRIWATCHLHSPRV